MRAQSCEPLQEQQRRQQYDAPASYYNYCGNTPDDVSSPTPGSTSITTEDMDKVVARSCFYEQMKRVTPSSAIVNALEKAGFGVKALSLSSLTSPQPSTSITTCGD
jgi:hypothetical protein